MTALENLPGGLPNVHIAVVVVGHGRGRRVDRRLRRRRRQERHLPVRAARRLHGRRGLADGATFISDVERRPELHRQPRRTCSPASPRWARAAAGSSTSSRRSRARSAPTVRPPPAENQGFLRADAYLAIVMITNEDDCSALAGRSAVRRSPSNTTIDSQLGPADQLPLQRVRPRLRRRPSRAATRRTTTSNATRTYDSCVSAEDGALLRRRGHRRAASRRSRPIPTTRSWSRRSRVSRRRTPCTGSRRRRAVTLSPWPEISHSCMAADGSFADPSPRISQLVQRVRAERPAAGYLRRRVRARAQPHRRQDRRSHPQAVHRRAGREEAGHGDRRLHGDQLLAR